MSEKVKVSRMYIKNEGSLKAFCDIVLYDEFAIHGLKVVDNGKGLFVSMPREEGKNKDGETEWYDICHPITSEMHMDIERVVLSEYKLRESPAGII